MDFTILNSSFEPVYILDTYESFIWVDKFNEPGTFELYASVTKDILEFIKPDYMIRNPLSEHVMIIEDISYESDSDNGNHIKAIGRSLESILDRRIVWTQTNFNNASIDSVISTLLNDAIITPSIPDRKIDNFDEYTPSNDARITALKVNHQYTGDNLLTVIEDLCSEFGIGFKIILNEEGKFVFSLYQGQNRSYNQTTNPYVTFSPEFDNVIRSTYTDEMSSNKNVVLVGGSGEGTSRLFKTVGAKKGFARREMFADAKDIQKGSLSTSKYMALLEYRGVSVLDETNHRITFDSECDTSRLYVYDKDFFLGDIVQIANEYGIEASARVTEFTWSSTSSGVETYPTFLAIEDTVITGKNKLALTLENLKALNTAGEWTGNIWVNNNVILTVNTDAYDRVVGITFSGKNSSSANIFFLLGDILLSEEDAANNLVLSGCVNGSTTTYRLSQYDKTSKADRAYNYDGDTLITVLDKTHDYQVRLTFFRNKDFNNVTLYPMVRSVTESSTFEPYDPNL